MTVDGPIPSFGCIRHDPARPGEPLTLVVAARRLSVSVGLVRRLLAEHWSSFHKLGWRLAIDRHDGNIDAYHDELLGGREDWYRADTRVAATAVARGSQP
jgi:hypothetical protein